MSKEMREQIDTFKNFYLKESKLDDVIDKSEKSGKESCLRNILNRDNLMSNKYDRIEWDGDVLKISMLWTRNKILSFLKQNFFNYWVDFKNKKLYDKNMLGETYDLTDEELDKIYNKYYWFKK